MTTQDTQQPTQRRRGGRKTKLTPERHARIIEAIDAGATMEAAAGAAGVDESTLYRWLQDAQKPDAPPWKRKFCEDVSRARDRLEVRVATESVLRAAVGGYVVKRVTRTRRDGTVEHEEQIAPADGRVGLEFLGRRFPERWGKRTEVSGPGGGPMRVEVSGSAIAELAERLHAELSGVPELAPAGEVVDVEVIEVEGDAG